jgi:hypothetical protein
MLNRCRFRLWSAEPRIGLWLWLRCGSEGACQPHMGRDIIARQDFAMRATLHLYLSRFALPSPLPQCRETSESPKNLQRELQCHVRHWCKLDPIDWFFTGPRSSAGNGPRGGEPESEKRENPSSVVHPLRALKAPGCFFRAANDGGNPASQP